MSVPVEKVAIGSVTLQWVDVNGQGELFFIEGRPHEGGRQTLLKRTLEGEIVEITPAPIHVKSRVNEYGGKAYCLLSSGEVAYVDDKQGGALFVSGRKVTDGKVRLADLIEGDPGTLIGVAEMEDQNFLASVNLKSGAITPIFNTSDFVAAPARSKEGKLLWLAWNHPHMPWDSTTLYCQEGDQIKALLGSDLISLLQPEWSPNSRYLYLSDVTGFWNLFEEGKPLFSMEVDCAKPPWVLGEKNYAVEGDDMVLSFQKDGCWKLAHRRQETWILLPVECADLSSVRLHKGVVYFAASFIDDTRKICSFDLATWELKKLYGQRLEVDKIPFPELITFPAGGQTVTAYYYAPTVQLPGLPPLLVRAHGGPTSQAVPAFNWTVAYWTSQGFAFLDVNYRGSSGFGRKFRQALNGHWGEFDWQDCEKAASLVVKRGLANPEAVFITGSSSGGFTALSCLTWSPLFRAGTAYYGVINRQGLSEETKFESHYIDQLVGGTIPPFPYEELNRPFLFFHGKEDKIVPPNQPEQLYQLLKSKGIETDLILYENEGHGFRGEETLIDTLKREWAFYNQFVPPRPEVIHIEVDEPLPQDEPPPPADPDTHSFTSQ